MNIKSIDLAWIVVNDLKKAIHFYTDNVGLKLKELHEEYGWAELQGHDGGARLGIAQRQSNSSDSIEPGQNAVLTLTVTNLQKSIDEMTKNGTKLVGELQEIPGHVKLQMVQDLDGNHFQIVESLHP